MTPGSHLSRELGPYVDRHEAEAIDRIGERLIEERPLPRPAFRAELGARLRSQLSSPGIVGPKRLKLAVLGNVGAGLALLAVAAVGLAGAGPLG